LKAISQLVKLAGIAFEKEVETEFHCFSKHCNGGTPVFSLLQQFSDGGYSSCRMNMFGKTKIKIKFFSFLKRLCLSF